MQLKPQDLFAYLLFTGKVIKRKDTALLFLKVFHHFFPLKMNTLLQTVFVLIVSLGVSSSQVIDTDGPPTWEGNHHYHPITKYHQPTLIASGALTQTQCSTFFTSGLFEGICRLNNTALDSITCDVHCQCAHNSVWGECIDRPAGTVGTIVEFGPGMCTCYYQGGKATPIGWTAEPRS